MSPCPNLLAQLAAERHWTAEEAVNHYEAAARDLGEDSSISSRQWIRWCSGELKQLPRPVNCRVLERMFGRGVAELFTPPGGSSREMPIDGSIVDLTAVAETAAQLLADVESAVLGPATLEQLGEDILQMARTYATTPPATVIASAMRLQHRVRDLLVRTARPDQQSDLYLVLGELAGLLSIASFDLGDVMAASSLARTAWGYGEHVGHDGLRTWARSTQALLAYWSGRPAEAVRLAKSAHRYQPVGTALVRAHYIEARSHAHNGDRASAERSLHAAWDARDRAGHDDLHDGVGGEFGYSAARAARCEGSVWVQLGDGRLAVEKTRQAVDLFATEQSLKVGPQAHADLAAGLLLCGDIRGAAEQLALVFDVPPAHRVTGLSERLRTVGRILVTEPMRSQPSSPKLLGAIREFVRTPAGRTLESPPTHRAITSS